MSKARETIKNTITATIVLSVLGLTVAALVGPTYNINNSKVRTGGTRLNQLVELKGEDKIRYISYGANYDDLKGVVVNGKKYDKSDTLIFEEAQRRYNYLQEEISLRRTSRMESKLKKKLYEEKEEQEKILEILRK